MKAKLRLSLAKLASPEGNAFASLDRVLYNKLHEPSFWRTVPKEIQLAEKKMAESAAKSNVAISGRQTVKLILEYFDVDDHNHNDYTMRDLEQITWWGDEQLCEFCDMWERVLENTDPKIGE